MIALVFISYLLSLNLSLHDYDNPSASHILDTEIIDDLLIVSGMIGGIEFYDISNRETLNHLSTLNLPGGGGGGGGGGGAKPNCVRVSGDYAYVTTKNGVAIINISNPSNPQSLGYISQTSGYILENLDIKDNFLAVAAHDDGVLVYDISNPTNPEFIVNIPASNAWTVHFGEWFLWVADGTILSSYQLLYNFDAFLSVELSNNIKDIDSVDGTLMYVALGSDGVALLNLAVNALPQIMDVYNTSAMANRIQAFDGNKIAVSDWDDIEILGVNGFDLELLGYKNTTRRTMALSVKDNYIYSGEWASVQVFEYGDVQGPDIDLNTYELNYPYVENGSTYTMALDVTNNGNQILNVIDAYTTNNEFNSSPLANLSPGETQTVTIAYSANSNNSSGSYRILSDDFDENEIICETNGNIDGANIGDVAPDFNLPIIANGNGSFSLSDNLGKIIIMAFFAPN